MEAETTQPPKPKKPVEDRVSLTEENSQKLENWIAVVLERKKGTHLTKKSLVNWIVSNLPETPSKSDLSQLINIFFDEERHLRLLIKEVRDRKTNPSLEPTVSPSPEET